MSASKRDENTPNPNVRKVSTTGSDKPRPAKPPPAPLPDARLEAARQAMREYDAALGDVPQRIKLHAAIVVAFACDAETLRYRLAVAERRATLDAQTDDAITRAKAELDARAVDATGRAGRPPGTPGQRGGRRPNGTLGAAESVVTPRHRK